MPNLHRASSPCTSTCFPSAAVPPEPYRKPGCSEPNDASCDRPLQSTKRRSCAITHHPRRAGSPSWRKLQSSVLAFILVLLVCSQGVAANDIYTAEPMEAWTELILDRSEPPARPMRLQRRQDTATSLSTETAAASSTSASSTPSSTTSGATIQTATSSSETPLPSPFDSSMRNNFTASSCSTFFDSFLGNDSFEQCHPLSLLLQTSNSFFTATHSFVRLTQTLDATCAVNFTVCSTLMASLATQIRDPANCGADLSLQNPMVQQAYNGFIGYNPLYRAGCLTADDGSYCFANAVTNSSAPTSSYIYYLPLGVQLPSGTQPSCNLCLQDTMSIFAAAASNSSVPLNADYTDAAQQVDSKCGTTFVEASVRASGMGASSFTIGGSGSLGFLSLVVVIWGLLV